MNQGEAVAGRTWEEIAAQAYRAYAASTGGKNYQGLPMPQWSALSPAIQTAWEAAVRHANDVALASPIGPPPDPDRWSGWLPRRFRGDPPPISGGAPDPAPPSPIDWMALAELAYDAYSAAMDHAIIRWANLSPKCRTAWEASTRRVGESIKAVPGGATAEEPDESRILADPIAPAVREIVRILAEKDEVIRRQADALHAIRTEPRAVEDEPYNATTRAKRGSDPRDKVPPEDPMTVCTNANAIAEMALELAQIKRGMAVRGLHPDRRCTVSVEQIERWAGMDESVEAMLRRQTAVIERLRTEVRRLEDEVDAARVPDPGRICVGPGGSVDPLGCDA